MQFSLPATILLGLAMTTAAIPSPDTTTSELTKLIADYNKVINKASANNSVLEARCCNIRSPCCDPGSCTNSVDNCYGYCAGNDDTPGDYGSVGCTLGCLTACK